MLHPLGDRVLVRPDPAEEKKGLLYLAPSADPPTRGTVVAVGPGRYDDAGRCVPMSVEAGERVFYGRFSGIELDDGGEKLIVLRDGDLIAVIGNDG